MRPAIVLFFLALLSFPAGSAEKSIAFTKKERIHNRYQPANEVLNAIGVRPGMVVGEIGAGRGRYTLQIALRVGGSGKVYANDVDEEAIQFLKNRCKKESIGNVETILGTPTDPQLPAAKLDVVIIVSTYHHIEKPVQLMKNILPAMKKGGKLAIVEHDPEKYKANGLDSEKALAHTTARDNLVKQAREAGYDLGKVETFLKYDNIYVFYPR